MSPYRKEFFERLAVYGCIGAFCVVSWVVMLSGLVALVKRWL
jgi:hypothetical protein